MQVIKLKPGIVTQVDDNGIPVFQVSDQAVVGNLYIYLKNGVLLLLPCWTRWLNKSDKDWD